MNLEIIKAKYPKSFKSLIEFAFNQMTLGGLDPEMKKVIPIEQVVGQALKSNIRLLYDFFDGYEIKMTPVVVGQWWDYKIEDHSGESSLGLTSRKLIEEAGFEECFNILEKKFS